jgi:Flp pilus assembly pilin Flp
VEGGENMLRKKKGQSTMEYIVLFAAVVAAILAFAYTSLRGGVKRVLTESGNKIDASADKFSKNIP